MRLLVVEDDALLGDGLQVGLTQSGFAVDWVRDHRSALAALANPRQERFSALVLDLGLPDGNGLDVLRHLRGTAPPLGELPVLLLTARDTLADKLAGFRAGADDYLVKPFDLDELSARIQALIRRAHGRASAILRHGELEIDPSARRVRQGGHGVELSSREFALLEALVENAGRVLSRGELESLTYAWGEAVESNAIEVHIHHLRRKLGSQLIRTIRGTGYTVDRA